MIPEQELWESAFLFGFGLAILDLASVSILVLGLGQAKQNCTLCVNIDSCLYSTTLFFFIRTKFIRTSSLAFGQNLRTK